MRQGKASVRGVSVSSILWQLLPAALLVAVFSGVGVMHVMSRVQVVDSGYRLSQLEQRSHALGLENDRLKLELATLKNPSRLERVAREQLGMAPPATGSVFTLSSTPLRQARHALKSESSSRAAPVHLAERLP